MTVSERLVLKPGKAVSIGVFPVLNPDAGGVYQHSLSILEGLADPSVCPPGVRIIVLTDRLDSPALTRIAPAHWRIEPLTPPTWRHSARNLAHKLGLGRLRNLWRGCKAVKPKPPGDAPLRPVAYNQTFHDRLVGMGIDFVLFTVPNPLAFECGLPFIFPVHDLQHKLQPEFPEVSAAGEWREREYMFWNGIDRALVVYSESDVGTQDILTLYADTSITPERVLALPLLPPSYLDDKADSVTQRLQSLGVSQPYFFYPAQFWPHKNHARLIRAIAHLRDARGLRVNLCLCGSSQNAIREQTYDTVVALIRSLNLEGQVRLLGYVEEADITALYRGARGMVMPTFFGPTNIPVLEAWSLECPVISSDFRGIREQVGDAGILVDPNSVASIADGLERLAVDDELCRQLAHKGKERLAKYGTAEFRQRLAKIIKTATSLTAAHNAR
jgi:glycosyltransferase involved in cell wall biosynthesis